MILSTCVKFKNSFLITLKSYLLRLVITSISILRCTDVVVAPPFVYIDQVKSSLTDRIEISAQNSWISKGGAFTGEIRLACSFLSSLGFHFVFWIISFGKLNCRYYFFYVHTVLLAAFDVIPMFKPNMLLFSGGPQLCYNLTS